MANEQIRKIITDALGRECSEADAVEVDDPFGDDGEKVKVCPETREQALAAFNVLNPGLDVLDNVETLENMLVGLNNDEKDKLYSHKVLKDYDLLP